MIACRVCDTGEVHCVLDLGNQPLCNRFLHTADAGEALFPLEVGQCNACGLVQLISLTPAIELKPRFPWISYNEPEGHLDQLAEVVRGLAGLGGEAVVAGVSYKDDTLLRRLQHKGFKVWRIDPKTELGTDESSIGTETLQDSLRPEVTSRIASDCGKANVLIARHILEHAHDAKLLIEALGLLVREDGYVVFEVPDCSKAMSCGDYSTIWEEHVFYFTPETLKNACRSLGFEMVCLMIYPYTSENALVAIVRKGGKASFESDPKTLAAQLLLGRKFGEQFPVITERMASHLQGFRRQVGEVALFGAGHLGCAFVNFHRLREHLVFVVDDNPNKQGLLMPGSKLAILPSQELHRREIKLALLGLSPESERTVVANNLAFVAGGGAFASIFPTSERALRFH